MGNPGRTTDAVAIDFNKSCWLRRHPAQFSLDSISSVESREC